MASSASGKTELDGMRVGTIGTTGCSITIAGVAKLNGAGVGSLYGASVGTGTVASMIGSLVAGSGMASGLGVALVHPTNIRVRRSVPPRKVLRCNDISDGFQANL